MTDLFPRRATDKLGTEDPEVVDLPATRQLVELDEYTRCLPWGFRTNFFKVFDLLLRMSPPPRRVFVFSDMQFSRACSRRR